ncbi:phosphorothioated DNA-binding restriction endonuclease [Streptomyces marincola]|uniref:phosphorothioated DNA-binding restriction endonuclease n=1 Tax=Streptomyces marincola TaxID=2878388 RepID=UPI001CF57944|nr:HNH endonuclease [Streptomyces marincola]UCM88872.1 HNH endonuclease [Streptomyces marincola]
MTREELLSALAGLRRAQVRGRRAPHKPLLVLWLLGRFAAHGTSAIGYAEAEEPVSRMINDFGPQVRGAAAARQRAAMPFVHLERSLWDVRDAAGEPIGTEAAESGPKLRERGAHGRLRPEVERLLADPGTLAAAARVLLDEHFTPTLEAPICEAAGLDLTAVEASAFLLIEDRRVARRRSAAFAEAVLIAYAYACAMCGFDGRLGRTPVGIEAAHIRWHSQDGPDEVRNGLALCALHHRLFDLGVLGLTGDGAIRVSGLYVAGGPAARQVADLEGRELAAPGRGRPRPAGEFVAWHGAQVFKEGSVAA